MNLILSKVETMSSREIAELIGKNHFHVLRDIEKMLVEMGEGGVSKFGDTYVNPQNRQAYRIFNLPKRETLILVSGYNVQMRTKIIDRWQELEKEKQQWLTTRQEVKQLTKDKNRSVLKLVNLAESQGSNSPQMYFMIVQKEINRQLGIEAGKRDSLDEETLGKISLMEQACKVVIDKAVKEGLFYKDVYVLLKKKLSTLNTLLLDT